MGTPLMDALDYMATLIVAVTPTERPHPPFRQWKGEESFERAMKDAAFDRAFAWSPSLSPVPTTFYGGASREETQRVTLKIGYIGRQDDWRLVRRIESDQKQVVSALQSSSVPAWPSTFVNLFLEDGAVLRDVTRPGDASNALVLAMPWRITYDVAT